MTQGVDHRVTEERRAAVAALKSFGVINKSIAQYLQINTDTLVKYYSRELETGLIDANYKVATKVFNKALEENDFSAQKFWLKCRGQGAWVEDRDQSKPVTLIDELLEPSDE